MSESTKLTRTIGSASDKVGSAPMILFAVVLVLAWLFEGVIRVLAQGWSAFLDATYQLEINTSTTVITFLMCFIIQNTQNRDGRAMETKLDAILQHLGVNQGLVGLEEAPNRIIKAKQGEIRAETVDGC